MLAVNDRAVGDVGTCYEVSGKITRPLPLKDLFDAVYLQCWDSTAPATWDFDLVRSESVEIAPAGAEFLFCMVVRDRGSRNEVDCASFHLVLRVGDQSTLEGIANARAVR